VVRESVVAVAGSTTPRLFQLAALGCCIVTHPRQGIDSYFEPEREVVVVHTWEEAVECYRALLDDESRRHALGQAARNTLLARHTHRHRAAELVQALQRR